MEARPQFWDTWSPLFEDANRYQRLLGKLIYLTVTHPDIVYVVSDLSQFMQEPRRVHWEGALRVLAYIKRAQAEGSSIDDTVISVSKPILTPAIEIVNLLQAIALTLEVTSSPGNPKNIRWYHAPAQSPSIEL